jgi:glycosyltransferase involved in cell wall biosynthesis
LTIALDASYSLGEELSGVGVYSREILWGLAESHPETRFAYCYRPHRFLRSFKERIPSNVRRGLLTETWGPRLASMFHGLNQRLPRMRLRRAVVTFHDLFVLSGDYSTPEFRARFAVQAHEAAARADLILTVSEFTKSQVVALLGVDARRIRVVHHGIRRLCGADPLVRAGPPGPAERIILNVGAIQKRKNVARLVEAFERLDNSWQLVLAGSYGYGADEILARISASPARDRIQVTGYVSPRELAAWYSRASVFAFPSLDEGFGMPVLEAMAAGVPVITSNRSALPEVAGDAAVLVDPEDLDALAGALLELTQSESRRAELVQKGLLRAQSFTWKKAVSETWAAYQSVMG